MDINSINQDINTQAADQVVELSAFSENTFEETKKTVGFWEFFGLSWLFAIPVVGFISCIVFMFSPKRQTLKNYARAAFAWMAVRLVTAIITGLLIISLLGSLLLPTINQSLNLEFNSAFEVIDLATSLMTGNYSNVIKILRPQIIETFGEKSEPLIDEFSKKEYNPLLKMIAEEDYEGILTEFDEGKYNKLEEKVGTERFVSLKEEVRAAAQGESTERFDRIRGYLNLIG